MSEPENNFIAAQKQMISTFSAACDMNCDTCKSMICPIAVIQAGGAM